MSEETHNEDSGEEKKPIGDSNDEDFGLPDLEFEELQELDLNVDEDGDGEVTGDGGSDVLLGSDDIDMSVLDDIEIPEPEAFIPQEEAPQISGESTGASDAVLDEGIDEVEDILDSAQLISDRLGDDEVEEIDATNFGKDPSEFGSEINYDDLIGAASSDDSNIDTGASDDLDSLMGLGDDNEEVVGLTEEEIAAIESMDLEDTNVEMEISDDPLADINSPDELAALGFEDEDVESPLEEESSSLFSADEGISLDAEIPDGGEEEAAFSGGSEGSIFESDDISLQNEEKIDFEPAEEGSLPSNYKPYTYEEATSGSFTKVIVIGAISFVLVGFVLLYLFNQYGGDSEGKEVAKVENVKKKPVAKKPAAKKPVAKKPVAKKPVAKKPVAKAKPKPKAQPAQSANAGEIVPITGKSGRSYVVVGSFIDQDLAMDYAKELSAKGSGVKIIHPYGNSKRYRVSIADFGSYQDAAGQLTTYKSAFGDQVWALKY